MKNLDENDLKVLFEALGQILYNQDKINKHLGINKHDYDWGYEDTRTEELSNECFVIAQEYRDIIEEQEEERRKEYNYCGDDPMIDFDGGHNNMTKQEILEYLQSTGFV